MARDRLVPADVIISAAGAASRPKVRRHTAASSLPPAARGWCRRAHDHRRAPRSRRAASRRRAGDGALHPRAPDRAALPVRVPARGRSHAGAPARSRHAKIVDERAVRRQPPVVLAASGGRIGGERRNAVGCQRLRPPATRPLDARSPRLRAAPPAARETSAARSTDDPGPASGTAAGAGARRRRIAKRRTVGRPVASTTPITITMLKRTTFASSTRARRRTHLERGGSARSRQCVIRAVLAARASGSRPRA